MLAVETIERAPKALLHDHLDGGLRPATMIDLAAEFGYDGLPSTDPETLAAHIRQGADRKSLELYLDTFAHTIAVMQERDAIVRVAAECAEDLAADGVVYAEVRMAPELCTERGLTLDEVQEAILEGYRVGQAQAAAAGHQIVVRSLVTAMRQAARSVEVAECAVRWRDAGVVGFDIAGPEAGYRPTRHLDAFDLVRRENFHITIHAGESFGLPSIWEALQFCGAERLGRHGSRRRHGGTGSTRRVRPRPSRAARDVSDLERPHGRRGLDRGPPHRPSPAAPLSGDRQYGQPADERRNHDLRVRGTRCGVRSWSRRDGVADHQRAEVGLRPVR